MKINLQSILAGMAIVSITALAEEIDITADVRAKASAGLCTAPTVTITSGNHHASYPESKLFDGAIDSNGRFLADKVPVTVIYEQPSDYDGYGTYATTKYVIRQLASGSSQNDARSPKAWTLYGWDGTDWCVIDSQSGITWSNNGAEDKTFIVPTENRFVATKYKLTLTENCGSKDPWSIGAGELAIYGDVIANYLEMGSVSNADGTLTVNIGASSLPAPAKLMVFYGMTDQGVTPADWEHGFKVASFAAGDTPSTEFTVPGVGNYAAVRFAIIGEATETTFAFSQFSNALSFEPQGGADREKRTVLAEGDRPVSDEEHVMFTNANISNLVSVTLSTRFRYSSGSQKGEGVFTSGDQPWGEEAGIHRGSGIYDFTRSDDGQAITFEFRGINDMNYTLGGLASAFKWRLWQDGDDIKGQLVWFKGGAGADKHITKESWDNVTLAYDYGFHLNSATDNYTVFLDDFSATFRGDGPMYVQFVGFDDAPLGPMQAIAVGEAATAPTPPEVPGYVFEAWDTAFASVTSDLTVRAIYRRLCTVRFLDKDGQVFNTQIVAETGDAVEPSNIPTYQGFVFYAWDKEFTAVAGDLDVTALYHQIFSVKFVDADGTEIETQYIEDGKAATPPDMTGRTYRGNPFSAWDTDVSVITGNIVVTATYDPLPDAVSAIIASGKVSEGLIWGGGAGVWNISNRNWYNLNGVKGAWVNGSVAILPAGSELTVGEDISAAGVNAFGDAVIDGEALTFVAPASITYSENATVRFENDVIGSDGLVAQSRTRQDIVIPASWTYSVFGEGEDICGQKTNVVFFANTSLSDVTAIGGTLYTKFGTAAALEYDIDNDHPQAKGGVFYYTNDFTTLSAQFQGKSYDSYGGVYHCVKVELTQDGADILGKIVYVRSATCTYGGEIAAKARWGKDWKLGDNCDESICDNNAYTTKFYDLRIGTAERTIYDIIPDDESLEFAGEFAIEGGLELKDNVQAIIDGGYSVLPKITIADGCSLAFGTNAVVQLHNKGTGDTTNVIKGGPVEVLGTVTVDKGPSTSYGPYNLFGNCTALNVRDGAELVLAIAPYGSYGYARANFNCYAGGKIRLTVADAIGFYGNRICLYGGEMTNECDAAKEQLLIDCTLADGALLSGSCFLLGAYNAYIKTTDMITKIVATGNSPSLIATETIKFGNKDGKPTSASNDQIAEFNVEDVTGDEASDLVVTSDIVKNGNPQLTVAEGCASDYRMFYGIAKKGDGTLELDGAFDMEGTVQLSAGTIRFGSTASGTLGALAMKGPTTLDFVKGASVSFDDTSAIAWAEDAPLSLTGYVRGKMLRVGTDANGLTAEQLDAILVNGKKGHARIDDEGYLHIVSGTTFFLK